MEHDRYSTINHALEARHTLFDYDPGPLGTVGPSNVQINVMVIETINDEFCDVMTKQQLDQKVLTEVQAAESLRNSRKANKTYYDQHKRLRPEAQQLHIGDLVLLHRTKDSTSRSRAGKFDDRWDGPYRIRKIPDDSTYYLLELDGTELKHTYAGNRLKRFFSRVELDNNRAEAHDTIRIRDALEDAEEPQSGDTIINEESVEKDVMENEPD